MKTITVLGSTGSIGTNTRDIVRRNRHLYQVYALAAGANIELLAQQIHEFRPEAVVVGTSDGVERLSKKLEESGLPHGQWPELLTGEAAKVAVSADERVD